MKTEATVLDGEERGRGAFHGQHDSGAGPSARSVRRTAGRLTDGQWQELLDHLRQAVILVDVDGRIVHANRAARRLLDQRSGIVEDATGLRAEQPRLTFELKLRIRDACLPGTSEQRLVELRRPGRRPLHLVLAPVGHGGSPGAPGLCAGFLCDPEQAVAAAEQRLRSLYGLTAAEAQFLGLLLNGRSVEEAAADRRISAHTARHHVRHILQKTGTSRQSELMRLVLLGPVAVFAE